MAERRIGVACATRLPGLSHEAAAQGRRAPASLERRTRQATDEDKRAGELATRLVSSLPFAKCKGVSCVPYFPWTRIHQKCRSFNNEASLVPSGAAYLCMDF